MKIGIFDSGLGGLVILRGLVRRLPAYDYVFLGDTARVPYGNRSTDIIYEFTRQGVEALFRRGCLLVILACNTASAAALRKLQREWLPRHYPGRRILGVVVPTIEAAMKTTGPVGIIGTSFTIASEAYPRELRKLDPKRKVYQHATPLLVPLIENNALSLADRIIRQYLRPLQRRKIGTLVLACTHYPLAITKIRRIVGPKTRIIRQDQIIPRKLAVYLRSHPDLAKKLSQGRSRQMLVTDITPTATTLIRRWFGSVPRLRQVRLGTGI